tara:strand:- start:6898 stop:7401 length:504 start_codon:yes stop_codon:yes gene_type:complete
MIVDLFLVYQFVKRLATPFNKWKAYELGIIDEKGNALKKRKDLKTVKERDAWGLYDVMISKIKKLIEKVPGGSTRLGSYAAALWLIKESKKHDAEMLNEETVSQELEDYIRYVENNYDFEEDAPANNVGGGAIAGSGGAGGEPGLNKKQMTKHKKKNKALKRFKETL